MDEILKLDYIVDKDFNKALSQVLRKDGLFNFTSPEDAALSVYNSVPIPIIKEISAGLTYILSYLYNLGWKICNKPNWEMMSRLNSQQQSDLHQFNFAFPKQIYYEIEKLRDNFENSSIYNTMRANYASLYYNTEYIDMNSAGSQTVDVKDSMVKSHMAELRDKTWAAYRMAEVMLKELLSYYYTHDKKKIEAFRHVKGVYTDEQLNNVAPLFDKFIDIIKQHGE